MVKRFFFVLFALFLSVFLFAEKRTLEELFPSASKAALKMAREDGYSRSMKVDKDAGAVLTVKPVDEISMIQDVLRVSPLYVIESLLVLKNDKYVEKHDIYNALCKISTLQGRKYFSSTRGKHTALFEDASRIVSESNLKKQSDPPPVMTAPGSETIFIMVKDVNFGACYYRADIKITAIGIMYTLTNFKSINYILIPVIKPEKLMIKLYIEALDEGVLIYGLTGVDAIDFAENNVDIPSTIAKRLDVIYSWIGDNIKTP
ncbi:MAG: hypothetical protein LBB22_02525 [Treponema sp.]|jgi:hypothetical protein|nr:hypothetical protein [Treponema sp.]